MKPLGPILFAASPVGGRGSCSFAWFSAAVGASVHCIYNCFSWVFFTLCSRFLYLACNMTIFIYSVQQMQQFYMDVMWPQRSQVRWL